MPPKKAWYNCYGKCNKIGNYAYLPAVMYNFDSPVGKYDEKWLKSKNLIKSFIKFSGYLGNIYVKWRIWISDRLFITTASKYV